MGVIIGMDEAGLGPNLGPFVVAATVWQVPESGSDCDLFRILEDIVSSEPCSNGRLQIADSKQVYLPGRGLAALETAALVLLDVAGVACREFPALLNELTREVDDEAWLQSEPAVALPTTADCERVHQLSRRLETSLARCGVRCRGIHLDVVFPERFNRSLDECGNKAAACSEISLKLLASIWNPEETPAFVVADRHGGRARYAPLLAQVFEGSLPLTISETPEISRYRLGSSEIRFECRAERHFAVACASLVAKYVRELSMHMFNGYWQKHVADLKPTAGYPVDARRFADAVVEVRQRLGISDTAFWRAR